MWNMLSIRSQLYNIFKILIKSNVRSTTLSWVSEYSFFTSLYAESCQHSDRKNPEVVIIPYCQGFFTAYSPIASTAHSRHALVTNRFLICQCVGNVSCLCHELWELPLLISSISIFVHFFHALYVHFEELDIYAAEKWVIFKYCFCFFCKDWLYIAV